jgi:hypothetical protein
MPTANWKRAKGALQSVAYIVGSVLDFHPMVVRDGLDPQVAHREFLKIDSGQRAHVRRETSLPSECADRDGQPHNFVASNHVRSLPVRASRAADGRLRWTSRAYPPLR